MSAKRAERLQVMLTIDEVRRVEKWRFENRMPSRSAAVRALMNLGLQADAAVDEAALLEGAVPSRDVGVVENETIVSQPDERPRVMVVAVDLLSGQGIGRLLERAGFHVIGPAPEPEAADALAAETALAAAVLDAGAASGGIAERIAEQNVPLVIVGEDERSVSPAAQRAAVVMSRASAVERLGPTVAEMVG